ncbi:MAG: hypothetical protein ACI9BG_001247, partial [Parasphingorhabdus sp.]
TMGTSPLPVITERSLKLDGFWEFIASSLIRSF